MLQKLITWWRNRHNFVIMDVADSSVTLSRNIFRRIKSMLPEDCDVARVFVFYIPDTKCYGFQVNPNIEQETQFATIQYNGKHKCIGFETLNPTVGRIFYDYGIQTLHPVRLSVSVRQLPDKSTYYQIERPHVNVLKRTHCTSKDNQSQ